MKLASLSDVHGNLHALEAVLEDLEGWRPDVVILNGDLVNRGPRSRECLERVRSVAGPGWRLVRGNHESFVLRVADGLAETEGPGFELARFTHWTRAQLGAAAEELRGWEGEAVLAGPAGESIHATHASILSNRHGIHPHHPAEELERRVPAGHQLVLTAHTHEHHCFHWGDTLLVNSGSVGTPFDRDRRACYLRLEWLGGEWRVEPRRLAFDYRRAEQDFEVYGFLEGGGPIARIILAEMVHARPLIRAWAKEYEQGVRDGEIGLAEAVARFLEQAF